MHLRLRLLNLLTSSSPKSVTSNGYLSFSSLFFPDSKINYLVFCLSPSSIEASGKLPLEKNFPTIPRCRNSVFTTGDENGNLLGKSARLLLRSRETKSRWKIFSRNGKRWASNNPASVVHRGRPRDRFIILAVRFQLTCRPHVRSPIPSFLPSCFLSSAANVSQHDQNLRRADQFLPDKWSRASSAIFIQPSFPSPPSPKQFLDKWSWPAISPLTPLTFDPCTHRLFASRLAKFIDLFPSLRCRNWFDFAQSIIILLCEREMLRKEKICSRFRYVVLNLGVLFGGRGVR